MEPVALRLVGAFGVGPSSGGVVGSRKSRRLLMLLAVERDRTVPLDRIVEVLWGDAPPRRPAENVATLVSRLRADLGAEVIVGGRAGYRICAVRTDLDEAAGLVAHARSALAVAPGPAAAAAERALALLAGGDVLAGEPDDDWVAAARAAATALLRNARHVAAEAALATGDASAAVAAAGAAVAADPLDEPAHRLLMSAHAAAGEPAAALAAYAALRRTLAEELGVDPDPRTQDLHADVLRGRAAPAHPPARAANPAATALTGRADVLAQLDGSWADAVTGRASLVLVVGEAGIGKTRLVDEFAARVAAGGGRLTAARCYAAERSLFLQPVADALGPPLAALPPVALVELCGPHATDLAGLLPVLRPVLGAPATHRASTDVELRRAFEATAYAVRGLASRQPLLVVLDDLQNAGLTTVELLHYLARHLDGARVLLVATVRIEEGVAALDALDDLAERVRRIDLGPLDRAAVAALAAADGRAEMSDAILQRTQGHTLFVVETLRGLRAGETAVPETLQSAVLARLRRAGPETDELLRVGAVLGATLDPAVAAAVLELPPHVAVQRCERAAAARLLRLAGRSYEFANDLVQEVLYATTPEPLRTAYHRRAADLLTGSPEAVAAHAAAIGDWPRAAKALLLAGERALDRYAVPDAEELLGTALAHAEQAGAGELTARAHLLRGRAREAAGRFAAAAADHRAALHTARTIGDERTQMHALRALGGHPLLASAATMAECVAHLRAGLAIATRLGDRAVEAGLLAWLAVLATNDLRFDDARTHGEQALRAAGAARTDAARADALNGLKNAHTYVGEFGALASVLAELDPLLRRTGNLELLQWAVFEAAFPAIAAADWDTAQERMAEALEINRRTGNPVTASWFVAHLGWLARLRGRLDDAERHGRRAVELAAPLAHRWFLTDADALLGATLVERGETAQARRLLGAAAERSARHGAAAHLLRCLGPLAGIADGNVLGTADALLGGIAGPRGQAWFVGLDAYCGVARGWIAADEPARARAALAPLLAEAERLDWLPMRAHAGLVDAQAAMLLGADVRDELARCAELGAAHDMPGVVERAAVLAGTCS